MKGRRSGILSMAVLLVTSMAAAQNQSMPIDLAMSYDALRKRKGFGSRRFDHNGNFFKLFGIARGQYCGGEVASQTNSGGASDALAGSRHDCD